MATYTSKPAVIPASASSVSEKFSDFTLLQSHLDALPAEERSKIGDISLTPDSIVLKTPQVGDITLKVIERTPGRVALTAVGSPVPMNLALDITPVDEQSTRLVASMDVEIPAILKPMLGGTLQKAVDQLSDVMKRLA